MVSLLRSRKFGIIIDEATDRSVKKQLAIVASFFDVEKFEVQYWLVDMIKSEDGTAAGIYAKMKESFHELNIPMANIVGYSSDTTNVMFGQFNSVSQLLKSEFPHVQIVKCSCHLIHHVSSLCCVKVTEKCRRFVQRCLCTFPSIFKATRCVQKISKPSMMLSHISFSHLPRRVGFPCRSALTDY